MTAYYYIIYIIPVSAIVFILLLEFNKRKAAIATLTVFAVIFMVLAVNASMLTHGESGRLMPSPMHLQSEDFKTEGTIPVAEKDSRFYFGQLKVYENGSMKYCNMHFDNHGRLTGDENALRYKEDIYRTLKTFKLCGEFTGSSLSYERIEKLQADEARQKERRESFFSVKMFVLLIIMLAAAVLAHLAIYYYMVVVKRKKSISSMRAMDL